jgi:peptide deformylase
MISKIVDVKQPSLRQISKEVTRFDRKLITLIRDMQETLKAQADPEGVGLAAPQIGKNVRVFLMDYNKKNKVIINPRIVEIDEIKMDTKKKKSSRQVLEGCLSLPHYYGPISRADRVLIEFQDETGEKHTEEFTGFLAHIVQHEVDHLNGIIFLDRLFEQKAPLYKFNKDDTWEEVDLI